jgi:hypothetical protein
MLEFDQSLTWRELEARLAKTTNLRHREMIKTVIEHGRAEAAFELDRLMATLSPDPEYHFWSNGRDLGPKGYEAVESYYKNLVGSSGAFLEARNPRIVVDDNNVVTEYTFRQIIPGSVAAARGYVVSDPNGHYIVVFRSLNLWPFNDAGELTGEDVYSTADMTTIEQVPEDELPTAYLRMLEHNGVRLPTGSR